MNTHILSGLVELAVNQGAIPQYLYRFRTLDTNFDNILINAQLWFSNPKNFNDPFDCQIIANTNNTQSEIEDFLIKATNGAMPKNVATAEANKMISNPKLWDKIVNDSIKNTMDLMGVCCFCDKADNLLLWSHYTNSHKGVCLKFDVLGDIDFFVHPLKVTYQPNYPIYNHVNDGANLINYLVKTKSLDWSYEEEIRIVKTKFGLQTFKKNALVEIIFGCKCSDVEINRIKSLAITNGYSHLIFKKATLKTQQYGLDFINV